MPSFNRSSDAIRSSPHVRFAVAMSAISRCRSAGNRGRPRGLDFHRQNNWKPFRCHRMSVSGLTTINRRRHSISRDSATSAIRVASSARRGFACRSTYNASCFLRNRFSAASWACDRTAAETSDSKSPAIRMSVRTRQRFQQLFLPDGIAFDGKGFVGTRGNRTGLQLLADESGWE